MSESKCPVDISDINAIEQFIQSGHSINAKYGKHEETLLHMAAYAGYLPTVKYLVESGADINQKDRLNFTPLNDAARRMWDKSRGDKYHEIIMFLLDNGADHLNVTCYQETAADQIMQFQCDEFAQYIRSYEYQPVPTKGVQCDD